MPVLKPRLPAAREILPYLEEIDERRWYTNNGPLVARLEQRLSQRLGHENSVVTTANATLGIAVALMARRPQAGSFCLMPSWTFAATPQAACAAGMTPWFHDVAPETWALDAESVGRAIHDSRERIGAVVVVSPFGAPVNIAAWECFEDETGIPVVIDAAAGFDTARATRIPAVVSLHATKILGAGEGGFIATTDEALRERMRAGCNFGFVDARRALGPALNAKMSEYHAAVALASLEQWQITRLKHARISAWYRESLTQLAGVTRQPGYGEGWVSATTSVVLPPGAIATVQRRLGEAGIDTRKWWGEACHTQPAFARFPRGPLETTEDLGARVVGLPHFVDMHQRDVERVVDNLHAALDGYWLQRLAEDVSRRSNGKTMSLSARMPCDRDSRADAIIASR